jgi:hypothetical protein
LIRFHDQNHRILDLNLWTSLPMIHGMGLIVILILLVVVGPLAVRFGADSRPTGERQQAWWPAAPRARR